MMNWGRDLRRYETSTDLRTKMVALSVVVVAGGAGLGVTEGDAAISVVAAAAVAIGVQEVEDTTGEAAEVEDSEIIGN